MSTWTLSEAISGEARSISDAGTQYKITKASRAGGAPAVYIEEENVPPRLLFVKIFRFFQMDSEKTCIIFKKEVKYL